MIAVLPVPVGGKIRVISMTLEFRALYPRTLMQDKSCFLEGNACPGQLTTLKI